jgi:peptide deformylase
MKYKIVTNKNALRKITEAVKTVEEGNEIARKLVLVMNEMKHVLGLSANQIGINKSVSVIRLEDEEPIILMNPVVVEKSNQKVFYKEGCVSLPGKTARTDRHVSITISTLNSANDIPYAADVLPVTAESIVNDVGLLRCVCIQHEIDHLSGKLMIDKDVRVIAPQQKIELKFGRNQKVMIQKNGETQFIKYKYAIELIENENWSLL